MVTLREVAARAGVSFKTVSRIVNDDPAVKKETRDAVGAVIREMNYVPDQAARLMRSRASTVAGLITDAVATTPYAVDIVRGAQAELMRSGRTLLIADTNGDPAAERRYWRAFRAHKAFGVVYAAMYHRPHELGAPDFAEPVVLANCFAPRGDRASIIPDDEGGGYAQAEYLLRLGHRRVALVTLNPAIEATRLRGKGIRRAFRDAGVSFDESLDVDGEASGGANIVAYGPAMELLRGPRRPTAVICGNDQVALQIFSAASSLGLSVPGDISVIGYDDLRLISETVRPRLTTVALPYFEIGRRAAAMIAAADGRAEKVLVPCPLVERESCRALV